MKPESPRLLHVGYVPLVDSAPLVAAVRLGLDRRHGLHLQLHRQASWAALRDKLLSGELDIVHALAGLVYGVETGIGGLRDELAILMTLNHNGQAIVLSPSLAHGLRQGRPLRELFAELPRRPALAQTFPTGTHAMWLYHWLAAQGIDPLRDIRGLSLPPQHMPDALAALELDGFCAGEPWGRQAEALGVGVRVLRSGQLWPGHPEKVLACRRQFAALEPDIAVAATAAVLEACRWLDASSDNRRQAAHWLAETEIVGLPVERLVDCLLPAADETPDTRLRFHADGQVNFPWLSDGHWFLRQFRRWGWLPDSDIPRDAERIAQVHRLQIYRDAARRVGVAVPDVDSRTGAPE